MPVELSRLAIFASRFSRAQTASALGCRLLEDARQQRQLGHVAARICSASARPASARTAQAHHHLDTSHTFARSARLLLVVPEERHAGRPSSRRPVMRLGHSTSSVCVKNHTSATFLTRRARFNPRLPLGERMIVLPFGRARAAPVRVVIAERVGLRRPAVGERRRPRPPREPHDGSSGGGAPGSSVANGRSPVSRSITQHPRTCGCCSANAGAPAEPHRCNRRPRGRRPAAAGAATPFLIDHARQP